MTRSVMILLLLGRWAAASPPSGYACAPGTANKGVGCTCPAKHREKRDAENIALCATAPTPSVSARLISFANQAKLDEAIALAKKYEFRDLKTLQAVVLAFTKWVKPQKEQTSLLASRGQCSAVTKITNKASQWSKLMWTMIGKRFKHDDEAQEVAMDVLMEKLDPVLVPLDQDRTACIATASKDDGNVQLGAAYETNRKALSRCFAGLPEPTTPVTAKIVIDADGAVALAEITATWPDLATTLPDQYQELLRQEKIAQRASCFSRAIWAWSFKPNARGFAGTLSLTK